MKINSRVGRVELYYGPVLCECKFRKILADKLQLPDFATNLLRRSRDWVEYGGPCVLSMILAPLITYTQPKKLKIMSRNNILAGSLS